MNGDPSRSLQLSVTRMDQVQSEAVDWLWDRRIPMGKITLISGDTGVGKSFLTLDLAARVSKGSNWPDGTPCPVGSVLLFSAEDGVSDTIRPRLDKLGADLERIHFASATLIDGGVEVAVSLAEHLSAFEREIKLHDASLLVIDPLLAFTGGETDTHVTAQVRALMSPLAALAQRTSCSILGVGHLNKNSKESNSVYRFMASVDFAAAARSVFAVGKHPFNPEQRVLAPVKSNLSAPAVPLAFHLSEDGGFIWDGAVDVDADTLLAATEIREPRAREEARSFLLGILEEGPVRSREISAEAKIHGIPEKTLGRAKEDQGIKAFRVGELGVRGGGVWWWKLPTI